MQSFDVLITNAEVLDGSGSPSYACDIGLCGDRIVAIGDLSSAAACTRVNVAGKTVSPGFIDVHTHDDNAVLKSPDCLPKVSQGVTTVVVGNCGISAAPVRFSGRIPEPLNLLGAAGDFQFDSFKHYVDTVNERQPAVNVAALVGHTSLRITHVGELNRAASAEELCAMQSDVATAMRQGAIGLSTGLAYANAIAAPTSEIVELARVASEYQGLYTTHLRNEFDEICDTLDESFLIGCTADLPVVISHLKCAGQQNWGRAREILDHIMSSPLGDRIHMDCYPYAAGSSNLDLNQVDQRTEILITRSEPHPEQAPKKLAAIAAEWGTSQVEAAQRLMPAGAVYFSISEQDMRTILRHQRTMIGSDGLPDDVHPHPRLYGTFPRVLGTYCRDESLLSLSLAIHKMTALPANTFQLANRGLIYPGYFADLVVFDPATIDDRATFADPIQQSAGIEAVYVNGCCVFEHGILTGHRAGRYLSERRGQ
ncbi:MAG: N-acyl-D-amino-acid deacylase family protein [Aeoliella sp.]